MHLFKRAIRNGKFIYSCLCSLGFAILKTAARQRGKKLRRRCKGTGWRGTLIEELMLSEGFNETFCFSQPSQCKPPCRSCTCSELNNLFSGKRMASLCIFPSLPTLTAGRCLRLILKLLPHFLRAEQTTEIT